jgi:hypothetical protein
MKKKKMTTTYFNQVITDLSSEEYHGWDGTYSSSQLKDALEDIEIFYKKYIVKEIPREDLPAFDIGTYFHTLVLEPHLIEEECAVYDGVRRGKNWDAFKEVHKGKAIVSVKQKEQATKLAEAALNSTVFQDLFNNTTPEVSCFLTLLVDIEKEEIYTHDMEYHLTRNGFEFTGFNDAITVNNPYYITVKARSDIMGKYEEGNKGYIVDLKSTTGNAKEVMGVRKKISRYMYDLSAAYYLDIFTAVYGIPFDKFYWTFASKDFGNCKTYLASHSNVLIGRAKWKKAIIEIAKAEKNGWKFKDTLEILEPEMYQLEWIKKEEK